LTFFFGFFFFNRFQKHFFNFRLFFSLGLFQHFRNVLKFCIFFETLHKKIRNKITEKRRGRIVRKKKKRHALYFKSIIFLRMLTTMTITFSNSFSNCSFLFQKFLLGLKSFFLVFQLVFISQTSYEH
jgi:hypothetical protein